MESSERVRLAIESLQAGKSEEAEAHLRHIPSGDVQYAQALKVLAGIYWHRRDFLGAKECCEQLLRFTPDNPHVLNSLGVLEMELGQTHHRYLTLSYLKIFILPSHQHNN